MKKLQILGTTLFFLFLLGCSQEPGPKKAPAPIKKPQAIGRINEVLVIADSTLWQGAVGDSFYYYFNSPYILLPQPEPIFDLQHMTLEEIAKNPVKKEFRTIVLLADLNDENSQIGRLVRSDVGPEKLQEAQQGKGYGTIVGQDKWAKGQTLLYLYGFGTEKLAENIVTNFPPIARRINESDMVTIRANTYQAGESPDLKADVKLKFGLNLNVPADFQQAKFDDKMNTLWLRRDVRDVIANILIHKRPYTNKNQLTKEGIKKIQNEITQIVQSNITESYMRINDEDLPLFVEKKTVNNVFTVEAKGIWDMVKDFKGGPFVSYLMLDEKKNELIFIEGFLFAPGKEKRNYMQEVELILSSAGL